MNNNLDHIPPYDPQQEQRKSPKTDDLTKEGIWVGRGEDRCLVDPQMVWLMAELGCPDTEICTRLGVSESTLKYNFSGYIAKARTQLKMKLRRAQIQTALNGQPTMLVWLGKNILGQSENPLDAAQNQPLPWYGEPAPQAPAENSDEAEQDCAK